MNRRELEDKILDKMITYAISSNIDEIENEWPSDDQLSNRYEFTSSFESSMKNLFAKQRRKEKWSNIRSNTLKIAAGLIIFLAVSFTIVWRVDALRVNILNFISQDNEKSTTITIGSGNKILPEIKGEILPTYLPQGYEIIVFDVSGDYYYSKYKNTYGKELILEKLSENTTAGIDSEGAHYEQITVNDSLAELYLKNDICMLVFRYDRKVFFISASLPREEVVKIAESMKYYN